MVTGSEIEGVFTEWATTTMKLKNSSLSPRERPLAQCGGREGVNRLDAQSSTADRGLPAIILLMSLIKWDDVPKPESGSWPSSQEPGFQCGSVQAAS